MALTKVHNRLIEGAEVNVKDFGAVGDGVTDDTAAIQAAIDSLSSGGIVNLPVGTYLTSATININVAGIHLSGSGSTVGNVKILASHTNGPVIRVSKAASHISDLMVNANAARQAAAAGTNYGIQYEAEDSASQFITRQICENVHVLNQPSHGFLVIGAAWYSRFSTIISDNNGGHGFAFDDGSLTSRTNKDQVIGFSKVDSLVSTNNGGHGFIAGNSTNTTSQYPIRINLINYDSSGNATDSGVRETAHDVYITGENHNLDLCAMDSTVGAGHFSGRNIQVRNSRIVGSVTSGFYVTNHANYDSQGITFDGIRSLASSALNPAVEIANANCIGTRIINKTQLNITTLVSDSGVNTYIEDRTETETNSNLVSNVTSGDNITIQESGVSRGVVTTRAGYLSVGSDDTRILFNSASNALSPEGNGAASNGLIDLGRASTKFKDFWLAGVIYQSPKTLSLLPSAAGIEGARAFITDATSTTFGSVAAGGGANNVPVYSDGTDWRIG